MSAFSAESYSALHELFSKSGKPLIVVHQHPDGDALGSATALRAFLSVRYGAKASIVTPDSWPASLDFLTKDAPVLNAETFPREAEALVADCDLVVSLDHNAFSRTGSFLEPLLRSANCPKLLIDHHQNPATGDYTLCFSECGISSTCELLYYLLLALPGISSPADLGERCGFALMTGMTTDTNNFANSVYPSTLGMASGLLEAGIDRDAILDILYHSYRENRLRAMGFYLSERLHITPDGVAYVVFSASDIADLGLVDGETEGFVNLPLGIREVNYSIFLKQDADVFRVSIRSKKGHSASRLASEYFHGGGHENAAGGRLYIPTDVQDSADAEKYILESAARFLRDESRSVER